MARLILHVGTGKTGTSFLQHNLKQAAGALAQQGWIVPELAGISHLDIALALLDDPADIHVPSAPELTTYAARRARLGSVAEQFAAQVKPGQTWVVSSEHFQGSLITPDLVAGCAVFFRQWFSQIDVVVYLRRQDYLIPSLYTETMKTLVPNRPNGALDSHYVESAWIDLFLLGIVRRWADAFGMEQVFARPYQEEWRRHPEELLHDFERTCGMPALPPVAASVQIRNESIGADGIEFLRKVYPELNERVLKRRPTSRADVGSDELGRALRPFLVARGDAFVLNNGRFVSEIANATAGPPVRLSEALARFVANRFKVQNDDLLDLTGSTAEWVRWLEQPAPILDERSEPGITDQQVTQILRALRRRGGQFRARQVAHRLRHRLA